MSTQGAWVIYPLYHSGLSNTCLYLKAADLQMLKRYLKKWKNNKKFTVNTGQVMFSGEI